MNRPLLPPARPKWSTADTSRAVCLLCLLGVSVSAALLPHLATEQLGWIFTHLE